MQRKYRSFRFRPGQTEITLLFCQRDQASGSERKKIEKQLFDKLSYIPKEVASSMLWARNKQDILYAGYLGLMKCIRWFDHTKCDNFDMVGRQYVVKEIEREKKKEGQWLTNIVANSVDIGEILETVADSEAYTPEDHYAEQEMSLLFDQLLESLSKSDKMVVKKSYGVGQFEPCPVRKIAEDMGLSIAKVIRIRSNSVSKLKKLYQDCELLTANRTA